MTTLEDRIADLQHQAGLLLDLPQQIADTATARINALGDYWQQRQSSMRSVSYVHQTIGDDAGGGTEDEPIKSIEEALRRTPVGGVCEVRLMSAYHFVDVTEIGERELIIKSSSTIRHAITLERLRGAYTDPNGRRTGGPRLGFDSSVTYMGVTLVVPPLDGGWGDYQLYPQYSGFAQPGWSAQALLGRVRITLCDLSIPTNPYCPIVGFEGWRILALQCNSLVLTDQPYVGNLVAGATDPAGTATASLPWLLTNLTTV